jgi:hypothetical protein
VTGNRSRVCVAGVRPAARYEVYTRYLAAKRGLAGWPGSGARRPLASRQGRAPAALAAARARALPGLGALASRRHAQQALGRQTPHQPLKSRGKPGPLILGQGGQDARLP